MILAAADNIVNLVTQLLAVVAAVLAWAKARRAVSDGNKREIKIDAIHEAVNGGKLADGQLIMEQARRIAAYSGKEEDMEAYLKAKARYEEQVSVHQRIQSAKLAKIIEDDARMAKSPLA